ncbi:hypothetical protein [Nocardia xishanensis]|uniref:hypothetical protein n=1 Tax=Nocardia xishanensis TaxID=238964 RepID=UPI000A9D3FB5|nr:hypothetical protein [Nocardia xishanensis]
MEAEAEREVLHLASEAAHRRDTAGEPTDTDYAEATRQVPDLLDQALSAVHRYRRLH